MKYLYLLFLTFTTISFSQNTYVPDDAFEQALIDLGYDSGSLDNFVPTANINTVTSLYLEALAINDLTGIEDFIALTSLYMPLNELTSIDLSNNTALTFLSICCNNLTSLDLSNNLLLEFLHADYNQITDLDLSNHPNFNNLDVRNNPVLTSLNIKNGNNTNFTEMITTFSPNLECITVDDPVWSTTNWSGNVDSNTVFDLDCSIEYTFVPDDNFEQALIDLGHDSLLDDYVITNNINIITELNIANYNISDLTGLEDFIALEKLECQNNLLTSLDFSAFQLLNYLDVSSNQLGSLNVKNSNNSNFLYFDATNNSNLTCIKVDNTVWSTTNWTNIDIQTNFDEECINTLTYIPDDNFEQALIDLGYDSGALDDYVLTANINTVTQLHLGAKNITDLTGIENFTALERFYCNHNNFLETIDLSNNLALDYFYARSCKRLENLNLSNNTLLTYINLSNSYATDPLITTIDLSNLTLLEYLNIENSYSLQSINLSNTALLKYINAHGTVNLLALDVSDSAALEELIVSSNNNSVGISTLDLSNNNNLKKLELKYLDSMISLDLSSNTNLEELRIWWLFNLNTLNTSNCISLKEISLKSMYSLDEIDVTNSSQLEFFDFDKNTNQGSENLINVDFSGNPILKSLRFINGELQVIDLTNNPLLTSITLDGNWNISLINLQNGNNSILQTFSSSTVGCYGNTGCILVDDPNSFHANFSGGYCGFSPLTAFCQSELSVDENLLEKAVSIYPNPVKNKLFINLKEGIVLKIITIADITGKTITIVNTKQIDFSSYASGIYFVKIVTDKGEVVKKLIKD